MRQVGLGVDHHTRRPRADHQRAGG
jgi:hypothetical protein